MRGGVPREDLTRDKGPLVFKVSGIRNPRSLKTTASLTIDTFDSKGFMIEFKYDMVTVAMQEVSKIANAQVTPSAKVVGGLATYTFLVTPATPLVSGDQITITFPEDYNVPVANTFTACAAVSGLQGLSCKTQGPFGLLATLTLGQAQSAPGSFSFNV